MSPERSSIRKFRSAGASSNEGIGLLRARDGDIRSSQWAAVPLSRSDEDYRGQASQETPREKKETLFTDDIWDILELCWKPQPRDRISASAVLLRLEKHPPLPMPSSNVGGDAESGSDESVIDSIARLYVFPASF
jgi:hypothetical protein